MSFVNTKTRRKVILIFLFLILISLIYYDYYEITTNNLLSKAQTFYDNKDFARTVEDCSKVINRTKNSRRAYSLRAQAYYDLEMYDSVISDATEAINIQPDDDMYIIRAFSYMYKNNSDKALEDCSNLISLEPDSPNAFNLVRIISHYSNDIEKVIIFDTNIINKFPNNTQALYSRASAFMAKGDYKRALDDLYEYKHLEQDPLPSTDTLIEECKEHFKD